MPGLTASSPGGLASAGAWNDTTVLVTGAGGFIGSHVVGEMVVAGARVRALVHYNARSDVGMLADLAPRVLDEVEIVSGDVTNAHQMAQVVRGCQVVLHLAALIAIPYSYQAPASYVTTNVGGTLNLLEAARQHGVRRFIQTSTSEVYGSAQYVPIDERHPLQAQSPYAVTKVGADMLALSFHCSFDLPVLVLRPFNTFGPRQSARAVIPTILSQLLSERPVRLGAVDTRRDFTFVRDTALGFRLAAESSCVGEVMNLGTGVDYSIGEVAEQCAALLGRPLRLELDAERLRPPSSEVDRLCADASRARTLIAWAPRHTLAEGLTVTADWIVQNAHRFRPDRYAV